MINLTDNGLNEKRPVKSGRDRKSITYKWINFVQFMELTERIALIVSKTDAVMRKTVCPKQRLSLTLRFLATGETNFWSREKHFLYYWWSLQNNCNSACWNLTYLKFSSRQKDWKKIENVFKEKWNVPHCIGAVDGEHIEIIMCDMVSQYYNSKGTNSVVF